MPYAHLLTQSVSYKTQASRNSSGDPTWSAVVAVAARVERETGTARGQDGNEKTYTVSVITEAEIPDGALIFLPGTNTANNEEGVWLISKDFAQTPDGRVYHEAFL